MSSIAYVGLDMDKTAIAVAVAEGGRSGEVRQLGIYVNRADVLRKMVKRLARGGSQLSFCYEAGPCGYGLHRFLRPKQA
jgi:transposase